MVKSQSRFRYQELPIDIKWKIAQCAHAEYIATAPPPVTNLERMERRYMSVRWFLMQNEFEKGLGKGLKQHHAEWKDIQSRCFSESKE